jgi:hypothetical protein
VRLSPLGTAAITGLLYQPQMIDDGDCGASSGMKIGRGNRSIRRKLAPSATLSTTNPTRPDPGSNPGRRGGKSATNRLSCGAASKQNYSYIFDEFRLNGYTRFRSNHFRIVNRNHLGSMHEG